jgi:MFS family permease
MTTALRESRQTSRFRRRLSPRTSFWITAAGYLGLMMAGSAPSPIYPLYQQRWHFATSTLTELFAVYALVLLLALLTVGGLSDHIGRRPVIAIGLLLFAADMIVFATASGVGQLFLARILQGLAAGLSIGAMSAGLIDLAPPGKLRFATVLGALIPAVGLASGAVLTGALVRWAPEPLHLVYLLMAALFLVLSVGTALMHGETVRRPGAVASLAPRMRIPQQARKAFLRALPAIVAPWAQLSFTLSLTSSVAGVIFGVTDVFGVCLLVALPCAAAAVAGYLLRNSSGRSSALIGVVLIVPGQIVTIIGLHAGSTTVFVIGAALAGLGTGAAIGGTFKVLAPLPLPHERGEFFAGFYVVGYLAFSVPAVIAGFAASHLGLVATGTDYAIVLGVLAVVAIIGLLRERPAVTAAA